jgi:hypothetical protein
VSDTQVLTTVDRCELLDRIETLRSYIHGEIGAVALMAEPTKACARLVHGLLDDLNGLESLLRR